MYWYKLLKYKHVDVKKNNHNEIKSLVGEIKTESQDNGSNQIFIVYWKFAEKGDCQHFVLK